VSVPTDPKALFHHTIDLEHGSFLVRIIGALTSTLEDIVGDQETFGYITTVGQAIGERINRAYCAALEVDAVPRDQLAETLVDLKQRIHGGFYIEEDEEQRIVLGNTRCPFGNDVQGRQALCMMTSNVFGLIAAETAGHARVTLDKTIAAGDGQCRVIIDLEPQGPADRSMSAERARDYFRA